MIVINSYGRSGSTMLWESLGGERGMRNLEQQPPGIYKTHDYPVGGLDMKMIYTFSNPCDVVASVVRINSSEWLREHCNNLKVPFFDINEIYEQDKLHLEDHLNAWLGVPNVAFVRYENMWDYQNEMSDFLGIEVNLPTYRERESHGYWEAYRGLAEQVQNLEGFFIT